MLVDAEMKRHKDERGKKQKKQTAVFCLQWRQRKTGANRRIMHGMVERRDDAWKQLETCAKRLTSYEPEMTWAERKASENVCQVVRVKK